MANNFSGDADCLALYRFESGALTNDSKGSNTLTTQGDPAADTTNYIEGSAAVDLDGNDGLNRANADLPSDWPFKNGTTNRKMSICARIRPTTIPGSSDLDAIVSQWKDNEFSYSLLLENGKLNFYIGYNNGDSTEKWEICTLNVANRFYSIGVSLNGDTGYAEARVYDHVAETANTYTNSYVNYPVSCTSAPLCIGSNNIAYDYFNGQIDEVVIFKDILTISQFDQVRSQTYGASVMGFLITPGKAGLVDPQVKPAFPCAVDWTHPLTRGLVGCWVFNEGGGNGLINLAGIDIATINTSDNAPSWVPEGLNCYRSNALGSVKPFDFENNQPITCMSCVIFHDAGNYNWFMGNGTTPNTFRGWCWFSYPNCVPWFLLSSNATQNDYLQIQFDIACSINTKYQLAVVYKGDLNATTIKCYSNSQSVGAVIQGNNLSGSTVASTNNSLLSDVNRRTSVYLDGIMFYQYLWNRALTASEVQSLYLSPYQFIKPVMPYGYYYGVEEAGVTVPIMWNYYQKMRMR